MIRKDLLIITIAILCLTISLFMIEPTISQSVREYDPWYDINDDGKIDIKDVYAIALKYGTTGEPINKTQIILDLQNRVSVLEEEQDYVKTIRLYEPNETMNNGTEYKDASVFVWNPRNATNNAILSGGVYFCYFSSSSCTVRILVNELTAVHRGVQVNTEYQQSGIYTLSIDGIMVNQNSYTIKFQISGNIVSPTYVKDINILLEVMDGLPPN